jgi:transcription initiation factor TFIID subunit 6
LIDVAHWLALEGVQPLIPQNPSSADSRSLELLSKTGTGSSSLAASSTDANVTLKPVVKHILSEELQHYFEKITTAIYVSQPGDELYNDSAAAVADEAESLRTAAYASLRSDPGLHQLLPYFVQFAAEKVTHCQGDLETLERTLQLTSALLDNKTLYLDPYVVSLVPPIITCLLGRRLGPQNTGSDIQTYSLRGLAASLLAKLSKKYSTSTRNLNARLARTCLKYFLDPDKPVSVQTAGVSCLAAIGGNEALRTLVVPNLKIWGDLLAAREESISASGSATEEEASERRRKEFALVVKIIGGLLEQLTSDPVEHTNGDMEVDEAEEVEKSLNDRVGEYWTGKLLERGGRVERWKILLE